MSLVNNIVCWYSILCVSEFQVNPTLSKCPHKNGHIQNNLQNTSYVFFGNVNCRKFSVMGRFRRRVRGCNIQFVNIKTMMSMESPHKPNITFLVCQMWYFLNCMLSLIKL